MKTLTQGELNMYMEYENIVEEKASELYDSYADIVGDSETEILEDGTIWVEHMEFTTDYTLDQFKKEFNY